MINKKQAKKILRKAEYEQFESVIEDQIGRTGRSRLMHLATVSRKLRDKYKGQARRQGAAAKRANTNETDISQDLARAKIYNQIIDRLQAQLAKDNDPKEKTTKPNRAEATATAADQDLRDAMLNARIDNSLDRERSSPS